MECCKCGTDCDKKGSFFIKADEHYYFCVICSEVLHDMDNIDETQRVDKFLLDKECILVENTITRKIILARMKRASI